MPAAKTQPRRWKERMRADATLTEQLANASDLFRAVVARQYRARSDKALQVRCQARAADAVARVIGVLAEESLQLERAEAGDAQ